MSRKQKNHTLVCKENRALTRTKKCSDPCLCGTILYDTLHQEQKLCTHKTHISLCAMEQPKTKKPVA